MKRFSLLLILLTSIFCLGFSQEQDESPKNWASISDLHAHNPAYAGEQGRMVFDTKLQLQTGPVSGFPLLFKLSFDSHLEKFHSGIGLYLGYAKTGFRNYRKINIAYNVRLPFGEDHHLRIGVNLGALQTAVFMNPEDILYDRFAGRDVMSNFLTDSYIVPDIKLGLWYNLKDLFVGIGIHNITRPNLNRWSGVNRRIDHFLEPEVYIDAGYNFALGDLNLIPMFQMRYKNTGVTWQPSILLTYQNQFTGGLGMSQNVLNAHLGIKFLDLVRITYSYGYWYRTLSPFSKGVHNIGLRAGF